MPLLLAMALANLLVHLQALGIADTANRGADMMLLLVVFLVVLIAGRVVPFFTQAVVPGYQAKRVPWVENTSVASLILECLLRVCAVQRRRFPVGESPTRRFRSSREQSEQSC